MSFHVFEGLHCLFPCDLLLDCLSLHHLTLPRSAVPGHSKRNHVYDKQPEDYCAGCLVRDGLRPFHLFYFVAE